MAKEKSSAKKVLSIIGNVFIWLFIAFAVMMTVLAFTAKAEGDRYGVPVLGDRALVNVLSDSMEYNENYKDRLDQYDLKGFNEGDLILPKKISYEEASSLQVGDIITFKIMSEEQSKLFGGLPKGSLNTHRIVEVKNEKGNVLFRTQGDNNEFPDQSDENGWIDASFVLLKYDGQRLAGAGKVLSFIQSQKGFLICVVAPLILFFIFELISFIRKFMSLKNEGKKQITAADEEAIKQRAVAEYLKQQAEQQKEAEAAKAEEAEAADAAAEPAEEAAPEAPVEEAEATEAPVEEAEATEAPAEEATAEEAPADEAPAKEAPAEEAEKKAEE